MDSLQNTTYQPPQYPKPTTNVVIIKATYYYRWSTPGQIKEKKFRDNKVVYDEKAAIKEQVSRLIESIESYRGFCSKCSNEIKVVFTGNGYLDKALSGRKVDREDITRLIEDAKTGEFQAVFTPLSSRLGRRRSVSATLRDTIKDLGVQIYSLHQPILIRCPDCYDPFDDDSAIINETVSDMQSELEMAHIRQNYKTGMPIRIKAGKPAGSLAYGLVKKFKIVGHDDRGNQVIEEYYEWDEEKTKIVKRIANEYLSGYGMWKICQGLNEERIPSSQGKEWQRSAIKHIVTNPAYKGFVRFGWKPVKNGKRIIQPEEKWLMNEAKFKGIWNEEFHNKIQEEVNRRKTIGGRAHASDGLLIGILKHADCHYSMFQIKQKKIRKNGNEYHYRAYGCGKFMHQGSCKADGIKQEVLDKLVVNEILKLANDKSRVSFYESLKAHKNNEYQEFLVQKQKFLKKSMAELERANKAYLKGVDTLEEYSKHKPTIVDNMDKLKREIVELQSKVQSPNQIKWQKAYKIALERFRDMETPQIKRQVRSIILKLIDKIEFRKNPFKIKIYYRII